MYRLILLLVCSLLLLPAFAEGDKDKKILIILSNRLDMGDPEKHDVIIDQRIVSTMFLPSAALVAKEMINLLENSRDQDGD